MKLFAQCGHGIGEKVTDGANRNIIDGAIISPKDISLNKLSEQMKLLSGKSDFELLCDPQFYLSLHGNNENLKTGHLDEWGLLNFYRRSDLEMSNVIDSIVNNTYENLSEKGFNAFISPNIYISKSFDSLEAAVAKNFIRMAKPNNTKNKIYATIAFAKEALLQKEEVEEFLTAITALDNPPDGFYLIIGSSVVSSADFFNVDILANWMLLNYTLKINGFDVINGYSDVFTPLLGIVGAYGGASGWYSNLQSFSMRRFMPETTGGSRPLIKYLCNKIMWRLPHTILRSANILMPNSLLSSTSVDSNYIDMNVDTPLNEGVQIIQNWEALRQHFEQFSMSSINDDLFKAKRLLKEGTSLLSHLSQRGMSNGFPRVEYLDEVYDGIDKFIKLAEL